MKRILCSLLSILFVIGIWFSVPMNASALNKEVEYLGTYEIEEQINPLYKGLIDESTELSSKPDVYYSDGLEGFDATLYSDDKEVSASVIREGMEKREATVIFYYKSSSQITGNDAFGELFSEIQELAFKETNKATQGDSLRLGYKSWSASIQGVTDQTYYYYKYTVSYEYYTTATQEAELTQEVKKVINKFGFTEETTDKEKSDEIYDYITSNVTYDYANLNIESYKLKFTPYAALINKTAVCQGYAMLYYRFAEEVGLDARVITGTSQNQHHAWNIVKIGDYYYYLDSTWDAGETNYSYYLKGNNEFSNEHTNDEYFETADFINVYNISELNYAEDVSSAVNGDFVYSSKDNIGTILKYIGTSKNVVVPATINGCEIKFIATDAFLANDTMVNLTFSEGILSMNQSAIYSCSALTTINFPSTMSLSYDPMVGVASVPLHCYNLSTVTVSNDNPYMKVINGIIYNKTGTEVLFCPTNHPTSTIVIPANVTSIAPSAFEGNKNLVEVILPDGLTTINKWAFSNCINLSQINFPDTCQSIGQYAFKSTALTEFYVPASLSNYEQGAFEACLLQEITVSENNNEFNVVNGALCKGSVLLDFVVTTEGITYMVPSTISTIAMFALENTNFERIIVPSTVTKIETRAFSNCANLNHVEIGEGVTYLGSSLFWGDERLISVIIPSSVTTIGDSLETEYGLPSFTIYYASTESAVYKYAYNNSLNYKINSRFSCTDGHTIIKGYVVGDSETYKYFCTNCGDCTREFPKQNIQEAIVVLENTEFVYGNVNPVVKSVTLNGIKLSESDYEIDPEQDFSSSGVGTYYLNILGKNDYFGICQAEFKIIPIDIKDKTVYLSGTTFIYTGGSIMPSVIIDGLEQYIDFSIEYADNKNVGVAKVIITGKQNYTGTIIKEFNITPQNISGRDVNIRGTFYYYDGTPKCPAVTIDGLVENMDFTVSYDNNLNAGIAKAVVQGIGNYTGNREVTFTIGQSPLPSASIELEYIKTTYTGSELCPKITIGNLIENVDFNVKYSDNINAGEASVTISGIGNYAEKIYKSFTIERKDVLHSAEVKLSYYEVDCDGSTKTPEVIIDGFKENVDYTVSYVNNIFPGTANVIVSFINNYIGEIIVDFKINNVEESPHTHNYTSEVTKQPTCTTVGEKIFTCGCGDSYSETITSTGHTSVKGGTEKAHTICSVCKVPLSTDHKLTSKVTTNPTCTKEGVETFTCECGYTYTKPVAKLGHDKVSHSAKSATCEAIGWYAYDTCSRCDYTTYKEIAKLGHDIVIDKAVEATCTKTGLTEGSHCSRCDDKTVKQEVVPSTGHKTSIINKKDATCTADGYTGDTYCSNCKTTTVKGSVIKAKGHDIVTDKAVAATCTKTGLTEGSHCSRCNGATVKQEVVPATGHTTSVINKKDATCTAEGYTGDTQCTVCKTVTAKGTAVEKIAHKTTVVGAKPATAKEAGYTGDTKCTVCGTVTAKGETIAKLTLAAPKVTQKNTAKGISLTWGKVDGAESYRVYRRTYNTKTKKYSEWTTLSKAQKGTSFVDTKVKLGTTYSYMVKAINSGVLSKGTPTKNLKYNVTPTVTVANALKGISVSWSPIANATGYEVYSSTYNAKTKKWSSFTKRATTKANAKSWTDIKAKSGTKYKYTVKALNGKVASAYNKSGVQIVRLAQPTTKIVNASNGIKVSWGKVSGATSYEILRADYNTKTKKWNKAKKVATAKSSATSWTDTKVKSGVQYRYTVKAVNGKVYSSAKTTSGLMFLTMPKPTVKAVKTGITVTWTQSTGATSYEVYRAEYNKKTKKYSGYKKVATAKSTAKSYTDKTAKKGVKYKYTVKAVNGKVASAYKEVVVSR